MANNAVIGKDNQMPWHLSEDLQHFKKLTLGHPIIMGRKTFESLGRPLPGRENIVLSRDYDYKPEGVLVFQTVDSICQYLEKSKVDRAFVIGGGQIYKLFSQLVDEYHLTKIELEVDGDTRFPELDWERFRLLDQSEGIGAKEPHLKYCFETYRRK
jgi:dihydrofolate reductase